MYKYIVGNDNGNSEHKIEINGEMIRQPNVYAKVRKLPMIEQLKEEAVLKDIEKNLIVTINSISNQDIEPGHYLIGEYALNSGATVRSIEVGVDNSKIDSNIVVVNTLAQIAGKACKEYYMENKTLEGLDKNEIFVQVDMATALPIKQFSNKTAEEFNLKFEGLHDVIVHVGAYNVKVRIEFDFIKTIPEGVTATWALISDEKIFEEYNEMVDDKKEKISCKDLKNAKILHIAIGEGTTELPVTQGIEFNPNFIRGIDNGIGHAIDKSIDEFISTFGLAEYSRQKYSEVLKNHNHKYNDVAMDISSDYIEEQAEQILHAAKQEVQKANNEIDYIIVYGGGSILMRKALECKLLRYCDRAKIKLIYIPEKEAVTLEAKGLYTFANSKIFTLLKNKKNK